MVRYAAGPVQLTIATIQELEPDARVVEDGFTVNERDVPDAAEDIAEWVAGLGY